jgi:hypothetical protein
MPYALIGLVASVALAFHYAIVMDASRRSKWVVAVAILASLVVWFRFPRWQVAAISIQAAVSVFVLVRLRIERAEAARRPDGGKG